MEFIDLPQVHSSANKISRRFFDALAQVDSMDLFTSRTVQVLVDYKWPLVRKYTVIYMLIPFVIFHLTFIVYSNVLNFQYTATDAYYNGQYAVSAILYAFCIYFLQNETR